MLALVLPARVLPVQALLALGQLAQAPRAGELPVQALQASGLLVWELLVQVPRVWGLLVWPLAPC